MSDFFSTPADAYNGKSITHIWSRINQKWLLVGALAGISAGLFSLAVSMPIAVWKLGEWSQPMKLIGATFFGPEATRYGPVGVAGWTGLFLHLNLSVLYGITFAQLVDEKSHVRSLVALGFVTSSIIWIFGCSLFLPSFNIILAEALPRFLGLFLHWVFGVSFAVFLSIFRRLFL